MSYKRYKSEIALSKPEKVNIMSEYIAYYERLINEQGLDILNVKIPRDVFANILDEIGGVLNQMAIEMASEDGPVKEFLEANPLPPHMKELLLDDFRVFSLLLNALKQWVSAESQSTDRYLLGGTARATCREAVNKCIVTGEELGENPELHHPLRDGRPPILLSKKGHNLVEQNNQINSSANSDDDSDNEVWNIIKQIRTKKSQSWAQLREGCNAILTGSYNCRPGAKSFANVVIRDTGLSASDILEMLDNKGL
ncbi:MULTISPECIES: hypothetical protein [Dehalobacter]|jgi:hypothetical protein|uniref:Uncharacterized protein n=2 Tax=Dehalobacter restrictus TaxID=55583 RepID=A0A857DGB9_9FIRM|nr:MULTISPECIES: hypothetical protein [Dehalobacter]AHF11236.1 hypothetical protein DEHRE_02225 [Dehalobacter restrictus DSM 9455]MCG1024924.1 hypothetical protein [Dehalobacter sp.]QGZ99588.1 hypothetical protein GQ588_02445 [Dehalobacter restrictus]